MILLLLTPPDKARVTNISPDDSDPLKLVDVNCIANTIELIKRVQQTKSDNFAHETFYT